ncbi:hypothetical protein PDIG_67080 [Penicillium digitatum PHI26]|uniref:Uncharacterized protein n=1 Tax=Penicillium digitatum (strain PHI26 / CECT 20796) TaxID=1170229 RepID=K9FHZ6_PEND2|nr:hypothetical protein PDIG_67080 [Penicillium digitatum PHI26]
MHFSWVLCNFPNRSLTVWFFGKRSVYIAYLISYLNILVSLNCSRSVFVYRSMFWQVSIQTKILG